MCYLILNVIRKTIVRVASESNFFKQNKLKICLKSYLECNDNDLSSLSKLLK